MTPGRYRASPAWAVPRRTVLAAWRAFNTTLDEIFYDVGALSPAERAAMVQHTVPEGAVLVVFPRAAARAIRHLTPLGFVAEQHSGSAAAVDTVVVAGVGSSALGTAAFARDVADHLGRPVAGIVSGLGVADALSQALGGWFVFGARNAWRETLAVTLDALGLEDHVRDQPTHDAMKARFAASGIAADHFIYGSPDSAALLYVLLMLGERITCLVGHSKGNYAIENALEGWLEHACAGGVSSRSALRVVTLGAVILFPPQFQDVYQLVGAIDYFGLLNSRLFVDRIGVPGAGHSLNLGLPAPLSVAAALRHVDRLAAAAAA